MLTRCAWVQTLSKYLRAVSRARRYFDTSTFEGWTSKMSASVVACATPSGDRGMVACAIVRPPALATPSPWRTKWILAKSALPCVSGDHFQAALLH